MTNTYQPGPPLKDYSDSPKYLQLGNKCQTWSYGIRSGFKTQPHVYYRSADSVNWITCSFTCSYIFSWLWIALFWNLHALDIAYKMKVKIIHIHFAICFIGTCKSLSLAGVQGKGGIYCKLLKAWIWVPVALGSVTGPDCTLSEKPPSFEQDTTRVVQQFLLFLFLFISNISLSRFLQSKCR